MTTLPKRMTVQIGTETGVYTLTEAAGPWPCGPVFPFVAYSMRDERWADFEYDAGYTLGGAGCLITAIAMIGSRVYGDRLTPLILAKALRAAGAFYKGMLVHSEKVPQVRDRLTCQGAMNWHGGLADVAVLRQELDDHGLTIIQLLARGTQTVGPTVASHFVVLESLTDGDAGIIDPWDGCEKLLSQTPYVKAGWSVARSVYGLRRYRVRF